MRGALRRSDHVQRSAPAAPAQSVREWTDRSNFRICLLCRGPLGDDPWIVITSADRYYAIAVHEACMKSRADHHPEVVGLPTP